MNKIILTILTLIVSQLLTYGQFANAAGREETCGDLQLCMEIAYCDYLVSSYPNDEDSFNIELSNASDFVYAYCIFGVGLVPPNYEEEVIGSNRKPSNEMATDQVKLNTKNEKDKNIKHTKNVKPEEGMILISSKDSK
jgi:hypothetical protein